jgi:acetyl esterase/lipase
MACPRSQSAASLGPKFGNFRTFTDLCCDEDVKAGGENLKPAGTCALLCPWAPAHGYEDVIEFLIPIDRVLVQSGARRLVLMGDSAGANIALSLLQRAREADLPAPSKLILIAPPVDLSFGNPLTRALEGRDPLSTIASARAGASWYAKDIPLHDARISPLFGSFRHLPATQVFIGTNDIFLLNVRLFRE